MMRGPRCPSESEIIDGLLGRLPFWKREWTAAHLLYCPKCRDLERQWRDLLEAEPVAPGPRLKRRLRSAWTVHRWRLRFGARNMQAAAAAVLVVFAFAAWMTAGAFRSGDGDGWPGDSRTVFADGDVIRMMDIAARPHTQRYALVAPETSTPAASDRAKGFVWVDKAGDELLVLVDGEKAAIGRDYQAWLVLGGDPRRADRRSAGVLRWLNGKAYLQYQGATVRQAEGVALSLEPKGGSVRPSGPDAAWAFIGTTPAGDRG